MQPFTSLYPSFAPEFVLALIWAHPIVLVILLWAIILKGYALWYAARGGQKWWFIALLVVNTVGILELVYLIWFRPTSSPVVTPVQSSSQA